MQVLNVISQWQIWYKECLWHNSSSTNNLKLTLSLSPSIFWQVEQINMFIMPRAAWSSTELKNRSRYQWAGARVVRLPLESPQQSRGSCRFDSWAMGHSRPPKKEEKTGINKSVYWPKKSMWGDWGRMLEGQNRRGKVKKQSTSFEILHVMCWQNNSGGKGRNFTGFSLFFSVFLTWFVCRTEWFYKHFQHLGMSTERNLS